jgi:hypothetical protein
MRRFVLCSFLGGDIPQDTDEDVIFVVRAINELWASDIRTPTGFHHSFLQDHVAYCGSESCAGWTRPRGSAAFSAYFDSPNECQDKYFNDGGPRGENFLREVLRLHPPSGRLARATPSQFPGFLTWGSASDEVADLEALHRIHISGDNTDIFLTPCDFTVFTR